MGGARAVEQLRLILIELRVAPLRDAVHVGLAELKGVQDGKGFSDYEYLTASAHAMLEELSWWTHVLSDARRGPGQ